MSPPFFFLCALDVESRRRPRRERKSWRQEVKNERVRSSSTDGATCQTQNLPARQTVTPSLTSLPRAGSPHRIAGSHAPQTSPLARSPDRRGRRGRRRLRGRGRAQGRGEECRRRREQRESRLRIDDDGDNKEHPRLLRRGGAQVSNVNMATIGKRQLICRDRSAEMSRRFCRPESASVSKCGQHIAVTCILNLRAQSGWQSEVPSPLCPMLCI